MKKILLIFLSTYFTCDLSPSFAKTSSTINGFSSLKKAEYDSLKVNGNLECDDLIIQNSLFVNGKLNGKNLNCKTLTINGFAKINKMKAKKVLINGSFQGNNIEVKENAEFNGTVKIEKSELNTIQIKNKKSILIDTVINGKIDIKKNNKEICILGWKPTRKSKQVLELKGETKILGNITFEEEGEIHIFDHAKIEGKVTNAKIIKK